MQSKPTALEVVAALMLAVAISVILTPGYGDAFANIRLIKAGTETAAAQYNPDGVALPP